MCPKLGKNGGSCFWLCMHQLDEEQSPNHRLQIKNAQDRGESEIRDSEASKISPQPLSTSVTTIKNSINELHYKSRSTMEEDCIVFCFREDGRFEISEDDHTRPTSYKQTVRAKGETEEKVCRDGIQWRSHNRMLSIESRDSTQSDASTNSFAFPVLRWEWSGSPEQMPKPKDFKPKKIRKHRLILFKCFRF